uniref:Uncharacterized protein n=1 Tax=Candidatus Methanogaster sp. ANME-2c ERB4 TaxID=2759911 RepID=A0A7G9YJ01_9EURY|nr:hypothetical protein KNONPEEI_00023 [Methanosarcinales archaeon ANME-2c ERB4]QNO48168.1 hypothetical protein GOJLPIDM_00024 [Methanosarcinales archaeon ANME-2c ERB4]
MAPFTGVLCTMSSDVYRMARKELRHDRDVVSLLAGHLRGAGTGAAKSNAKREVQAPHISPGFGDFGDLCKGKLRGMMKRKKVEGTTKKVRQEGCIHERCLDMLPNWRELRSKFGYETLAEIAIL